MGKLLNIDQSGPVTYFDCYLRDTWPRLILVLLIFAAISFVVLLYRREMALPMRRRVLLGVFRALALIIVIVLLFEPVLGLETVIRLPRTILVLLDTSESMGIKDARKTPEELRDAALALGKLARDQIGQPLPETVKAEVTSAARLDMAKGILGRAEGNVFQQIAQDDCKVRYFGFGERLEPATGEGETFPDMLRSAAATGKSTSLGTAIEDAVSRYSGQPIAGVVVLTDGASNQGMEPLAVAQRMQERAIPLYTIGLGLPAPLDLRVQDLLVPDTVFFRDKVPVRVQITSNGFTGRTVNLSVSLDGEKLVGKVVSLTGKPQFEELIFAPEKKADSAKLEVSVSELQGEVSAENNRVSKTIRVIDDKIKVLYVEGKPRWEYRYLRQVLLRDHRLDVKFLLTEGDRDLAAAAPEQYLADFPEEAAKAFYYDLVILGDVPASYFGHTQLERIEELVKEKGGSFLMIAGRRHAPVSYIGTPIANVLPVKLRGDASQDVDDQAYPVVTNAGYQSAAMTIDIPKERNQELWALVKPLYQLPQLEGAKPAAMVLAELSTTARRREPYPLIAWQRYGRGKSLFVGTDQLWRLRFKRGDKYHARFWGQAIQFLTLSRLLGENKRIQLEIDRQDYRTGERVQINANVLNDAFEPEKRAAYTVYLDRTQPQRETTQLRLEPVPDIPGLYQGTFTPEQAGHYRLHTAPADEELANSVEFSVKASPLEQLEPAMQEEQLRRMAELSGGKYFTMRELPSLPQTIAGEQRTTVIRREKELWDIPIVLVVLVGLTGAEWFLRRRYDLI